MQRPPLVLTIQSQVVLGHVGNSAAVFPLRAAGLEVAPIPTVLLSNTPFYPTLRGHPLPPDFFADLLTGANERGLPERARYLITGYIASVEVAEQTAEFVARAKRVNPDLVYVCDPVMGDTKPGLYVPEAIARVIREGLMPLADIASPNQFEVGYLSGTPLTRAEDLSAAAKQMGLSAGAYLLATGCRVADTPEGQIETLITGPKGGIESRHPVDRLDVQLSGTGDLFAALLVTGLASGRGISAAVDLAQTQMTRAIARAQALGEAEVSFADPEFRRALVDLGTPVSGK